MGRPERGVRRVGGGLEEQGGDFGVYALIR